MNRIKEKAFTLVELLSVIVLLGVLAIVLVPNFNNVLKTSEEELYNKQIETIKIATQLWVSDKENKIFLSSNEKWPYVITLGDLQDASYIDKNIKNPKKDEFFSDSTLIYIYNQNNNYSFEVDENTISNESQVITLIGDRSYELQVNTTFVEPGVSAKDLNETDITSSIETTYYKNGLPITTGIDSASLANYTIKYSVDYSDANGNYETAYAFRRVRVVDTLAPDIFCARCTGNIIQIESTDAYNLPTITVDDNYDNEVSILRIGSFSTVIPGERKIVYVATDSSGNSSKLEIKFLIKDTISPIITNIKKTKNENGIINYVIEATDNGSGIKEYSIDGGLTWQKSNTFDVIFSNVNRRILVKDNAGNISTKIVSEYSSIEYAYTGNEQKFVAPKKSLYQIELWGAQGGSVTNYEGGKGGYTSGIIKLDKNDELYIYVGGIGKSDLISGSIYYNEGGYNGGGIGGNNSGAYSFGGGGATDVRYFENVTPSESELLWNSDLGLKSRIMVAAGGAGAVNNQSTVVAGYGGGLVGGEGSATSGTYSAATYLNKGATQTEAGINSNNSAKNGLFGMALQTTVSSWGGGGGGGYYGGSMGNGTGGSGGSSYISGYLGSVAIASKMNINPKNGCTDGTVDVTCSYHYSGKIFLETEMIAGNREMPSIDGNTEIGHSGNGYARITELGEKPFLKLDYRKGKVGLAKITIISVNELASDNKYQYYVSTSSTELTGGSWKNYTEGEVFDITNNVGTYYLWIYPVSDILGNINDIYISNNSPYMLSQIDIVNTVDYVYTESEEHFLVPKTGYYKLEAWGAQGGNYSDTIIGGYGAYASGTVYLEKNDILYINVGGAGQMATTKTVSILNGGYNGGGNGFGNTNKYVGSGGGATHIATKTGLLSTLSSNINDILIVAGGGGGSSYQTDANYGLGGSGGEFFGTSGYGVAQGGSGGTQIAAGTGQSAGSFGLGGSSTGDGTGGGGGYYGGGGGKNYNGGGGGSSYTGNSNVLKKKMYGYSELNGYTNVSEIAQADSAKKGNGHVKITYVESISNLNEFDYPGEYAYKVPKSGYYKLETWGASGGSYSDTIIGGYGAYASGTVYLEENDILYVNVGGEGKIHEQKYSLLLPGGYNGGGNGFGNTDKYVGSGGGATHIATKTGVLSTLSSNINDILIVAGGGGGSSYQTDANYGSGGSGGGITGLNGMNASATTGATGGTQIAGGTGQTKGNFGIGGNSTANGTGGGGGYYGGGGGQYYKGGGGGSGYISNTLLTNKYMYCYNCTPSEIFETLTYTTEEVNKNPLENTAKIGNGYAKITYIDGD